MHDTEGADRSFVPRLETRGSEEGFSEQLRGMFLPSTKEASLCSLALECKA
jgi:hypothetical protein